MAAACYGRACSSVVDKSYSNCSIATTEVLTESEHTSNELLHKYVFSIHSCFGLPKITLYCLYICLRSLIA